MDPQGPPQQQDVIIGQTIGNYLVTQKLGEGGMGAVYLAEHPSIGKKVALKVLHSEFSSNEDVVNRFFNEAKAVNNIGHPNIVDITDYGIIQVGQGRDHLVYFIMEFLGGMTLSKLIKNEAPLPPERALSIGLQVADALAASHRCEIVHRDLKPDNIMLLQRGRERDFVKLLDFGIAKLTGGAAGSRRTRTGIVMGTPAYMSPEQCDGRGNIDHRTDVYALGIVLYEMLTGRVPFLGEGYGEILVQHLTQPPAPPSQFRMLNPHVEAVVMKALEKRVELRYPTMDEMMRAMSDPVAFVESHGGIPTFGQVQLMPSTAPMPPIRLTPSPITSPQMPHMPTPSPGMLTPASMQMPSQPYPGSPTPMGISSTPIPGPGSAVYQTPVPGEQRKSRLGLIIGVALAVVAIVIVLVVVMGGGKKAEPVAVVDAAVGSDKGSDSGSAKDVGSAKKEPAGSGSGSAATVKLDAGSGSGSAGSGSSVVAPVVEKMVDVMITTKPAGARVLINGQELPQKTGEAFQLQHSTHEVTVTLQLDRYEDITFKVKPEQKINLEKTFKKKRDSGGTYVRPTPGSNTPPVGSGSAKKGNDTGLMRPGD